MGSDLWNKPATIIKNFGGHVWFSTSMDGQSQKPPYAHTYILSLLVSHLKE